MLVFYLICSMFLICKLYGSNETCYEGTCYSIQFTKLSFANASNECRKLNLSLAFLQMETVQSYLKVLSKIENQTVSSHDGFYIGLKYIPNQRFIWDSNSDEVPNLRWLNTLIPGNDESCAFLQGELINIGPCNETRNFICSNSTVPLPPAVDKIGSCPNGFFKFASKCYQMNVKCNDKMANWTEAHQQCKSGNIRNSLIVIDSLVEQEFVTALMTKSPQALWTGLTYKKVSGLFTIWVNENGRMPRYDINFKKNEPNNVKEEQCLMVYHRMGDIGRQNDENCARYLNYLCESPLIQVDSKNEIPGTDNPLFYQGNCNSSYYEFNQTCYRIDSQPKSYKESCDGNLAYVNGYIDIAFIRSLMHNQGIPSAWFSVYHKVNGINTVSNGALWLMNETVESSSIKPDEKSCYVISSGTKGLKIENCDNKQPSICYYYMNGHEKKDNPLICPFEWIRVGEKCYSLKVDYFNFNQSREQCKNYNGKLATMKSMKEIQAIGVKIKFDSWIGLDGKSFINDTWIDGTKLDYCQFRHTKSMRALVEKDLNGTCFIFRNTKSEWDVRKCSDLNAFLCEQQAKINYCPPNFPINIDGDCFAGFQKELTWVEAEKFCETFDPVRSHLASFHTWAQELEVFSHLDKNTDYWIGLRMFDHAKRWIDNTVLNYQPIFYKHSLEDSYAMSCFSSRKHDNQDNLFWNKSNCAVKRPFICEISNNTNSVKIPKVTKLEPNFFCPKGFTKHGLSCFKIYNVTSTWTDADLSCRSRFGKPNPIARLARFDNIQELESVLSSLRDFVDTTVWIGLFQESKTKQLVWVDETPLNFSKSIELSDTDVSMNKISLTISSNPFLNGQFTMTSGSKNFPYLCRVDPSKMYNEFLHNKVTQPFSNYTDQRCPLDHFQYNGFCYFYNPLGLNFEDAKLACKKNSNSELVVIDDTFEEHLLRSFLSSTNQVPPIIWMGWKVEFPNILQNWTSTNKSSVYYTRWITPGAFNGKFIYQDEAPHHDAQGCYVLRFDNDININNGMTTSHCLINLPSICKRPISKIHTNESQKVTCGKSINGSIYFLDVLQTKSGSPCIRWDLVKYPNSFQYHAEMKLQSSLPFNKAGYLSYSLERCSEFNFKNQDRGYSCYILKDNKYIIEDCVMVKCPLLNKTASRTTHPFIIMISLLLILVAIGFLIYVYRGTLLSNYRVRLVLARVLGRYQPDWLRNSHSRPQPTASGTGFINPIYTPLESRY